MFLRSSRREEALIIFRFGSPKDEEEFPEGSGENYQVCSLSKPEFMPSIRTRSHQFPIYRKAHSIPINGVGAELGKLF
jgi:hypothetical protein